MVHALARLASANADAETATIARTIAETASAAGIRTLRRIAASFDALDASPGGTAELAEGGDPLLDICRSDGYFTERLDN